MRFFAAEPPIRLTNQKRDISSTDISSTVTLFAHLLVKYSYIINTPHNTNTHTHTNLNSLRVYKHTHTHTHAYVHTLHILHTDEMSLIKMTIDRM